MCASCVGDNALRCVCVVCVLCGCVCVYVCMCVCVKPIILCGLKCLVAVFEPETILDPKLHHA